MNYSDKHQKPCVKGSKKDIEYNIFDLLTYDEFIKLMDNRSKPMKTDEKP